MAEGTETPKKKRERSPGHPGIGLEMALERARQLAAVEKRSPARVEDILGHWSYGAKSGAGLVTLAALKQFGLLTDEGSGVNRRAKLSDEAWYILHDEREDASERRRLIQEAALRPRIHRELWEQYKGSLPSDATLRSHLKLDRHFTDSAIADFIPQIRGTLAFAGLTESDTLSRDVDDVSDRRGSLDEAVTFGGGLLTTDRKPSGGTQALRAPLGGGRVVDVRMPERMSKRDWDLLDANLGAWKLATLQEDESDE